MIKVNNTDYFSSTDKWLKNRNKTLFRTLEEVELYQRKRIDFLKNYYNLNITELKCTNQIPNLKKGFKKFVAMTRSGTTSKNNERTYYYSSPEQSNMDKHHIWKIEKCHNLLEPGDVIWISASDYGNPDETGKILGNPQRDRVFGPKKYLNIGEQNNTYELFYNSKFKKEHWEYNLSIINSKKVKFIRTSPSVVQTIYSYFKDKYRFNCPVILSEETLQKDVKKMAERIFEKVIDKCVSWDGCLAWFECPYNTKHIYDEFCIVEETKNQILSVTDLQNLACPFFKYINGDRGSVGKKICECGLAGSYFKEFEGKIIESIYVNNENYLPGRYLHEKLSQFFRKNNYEFCKDYAFKDVNFNFCQEIDDVNFPNDFLWKIKQKLNLDIDFFYSCSCSLTQNQQRKIKNFLNTIIWQNFDCKNINFIKSENIYSKKDRREKCLSVESDYMRSIRPREL